MNCESYSKLLMDTFSDKTLEIFLKDLKKSEVVFNRQEVKDFFLNILIENSEKRELLDKIAKNFSKETKNLLALLAERKRYDIILGLYAELKKQWLKNMGTIDGKLVFAEKPKKKTISFALSSLKKITGKEIVYDVVVDRTIIGGFLFRSDELIIDLSVKYQLSRLKEVILK